MTKHTNLYSERRDILWALLFIIIFINGFESGGYQASLTEIGRTYDLRQSGMGIYAAMELFSTMLAPMIFGSLADRIGKKRCISIFLFFQFLSGMTILLIPARSIFLFAIFLMGLTTSTLQFVAISALADLYPRSGKRKVGYVTSMYSLGALMAPMVVSTYLTMHITWRVLFFFLGLSSVLTMLLVGLQKFTPREETLTFGMSEVETELAGESVDLTNVPLRNSRGYSLLGIGLLCLVMFIYVGFENGFCFFVDSYLEEEWQSSLGKFAITLFWAAMVPARLLSGRLAAFARRNLMIATIALPILTITIAKVASPQMALLLCIPLGFASGAVYPNVLAIMIDYAGNRTATAMAMITTATGFGGMVMTAMTGFLAESMGIRNAIIVLGLFFLVSFGAVFYLDSSRKQDQVI